MPPFIVLLVSIGSALGGGRESLWLMLGCISTVGAVSETVAAACAFFLRSAAASFFPFCSALYAAKVTIHYQALQSTITECLNVIISPLPMETIYKYLTDNKCMKKMYLPKISLALEQIAQIPCHLKLRIHRLHSESFSWTSGHSC